MIHETSKGSSRSHLARHAHTIHKDTHIVRLGQIVRQPVPARDQPGVPHRRAREGERQEPPVPHMRQAGGQLDAAALASVLQTQALQLHQVSGVLRLVNLDEGHRLMQAAESLLVRCAGGATLRTDLVEAVERAGFALLTYMTRSVSGARP